ncbi:MAG: hypothetical protein HY690_01370 [Chloroflexi bacterium]|nr:hypothetical protein [Chloroflexota bacterium]
MDFDQLGFVATALLVGGFLGWFVVGGEYNRRRAGKLARWVYLGLKLFQGKTSIRWLTTHAFEIFAEDAQRPFNSLKVTGLLESRDMVAVWLYNRLAKRPDLLVLRANLRRQPIWGCEAFRPRTLLSGDGRQEAEAEGWSRHDLSDRGLQAWHGGGRGAALCTGLLQALGETEPDLVRLAVHRREPHLLLAVSAARFQRQDPQRLFATFKRLADAVLSAES